jgi:hypothetical protein
LSSTDGSWSRWRNSCGSCDEQQPEDQEHEREGGEYRGAERDERRPQHEGEHDPDRQHLLLVLGRHREGAHDDDEHEQVVDRQALLDGIAREVLGAELRAGDEAEHHAEDERDRDVEGRPRDRLAEADHVRPAP